MDTEVSVQGFDRRGKRKPQRDTERALRMARGNDIGGAIKEDHVHMYLSVPPKHSPSHVMKILKGKSAEYLAREFPELAKRYWGMHIWIAVRDTSPIYLK
jgi:putative transposase